MRSFTWRSMLAGLVIIAMSWVFEGDAFAQCDTCPVPTVVYQPVVAQPTVAYRPYTGWYPGKWIDQWRLRRAGVATVAPAYTASYAPGYTASYAPSYTAAYRPYATSFAPLSAAVSAPCDTCTQTAYYPVVQTVARPVLMRPVIVADPACNTCSFAPSCGCDACSTACDSCSMGVSPAAYTEPACSSCAGGTQSNIVPSDSYGSPNVGQQTPQPSFDPVPVPDNSRPADPRYESNRPLDDRGGREGEARPDDVVPAPADKIDPGPAPATSPATDADPSTYYNAPRLLDPRDQTARNSGSRKPTVEVWHAVYRQARTARPATQTGSHHTGSRSQRRAQADPRSQAEIDADGWSAVAGNR